MKKTILLFLLVCFSLILVGCNINPINEAKMSKGTLNTIYEEAITGVNAIEASGLKRLRRNGNESSVEINPEEVLSKVLGVANTSVTVEEVASDKEGYDLKRVITIDTNVYTIYLSNINTSQREDVEDEETETEYKTTYDGIIIYNDVDYEFRACEKTEVEVEENETETETKLDMFIKLDENKYIKVKQVKEVEVEDGIEESEEKFEIQLREGKNKTTLFKIKKCVEDGVEVIKLEKDNVTYTIKYYSMENVDYVSIKVNQTKCVYKIVIDENNQIKYELVK